MLTLERLEEIGKAIAPAELERRGFRSDSPVSPNIFVSKNDYVSIDELTELVAIALSVEYDEEEIEEEEVNEVDAPRWPFVRREDED